MDRHVTFRQLEPTLFILMNLYKTKVGIKAPIVRLHLHISNFKQVQPTMCW